MKKLSPPLFFLIFTLISLSVMGASRSEMVARAGVLIEINSDSDRVKICNGTVIGTNNALTAQHCVVEARGSYDNYGNVESYREVDLNKYIFIAGEMNSEDWFYDWSQGENYFFNKHPGAARVVSFKRYGKGRLGSSNDLVHLLLDRDVISQDNYSATYFNTQNSNWNNLTMISYTKYNCGETTCFQRKQFSIEAQADNYEDQLLYRFSHQPSFNTASFSGSSIVDRYGNLVGVHISSYMDHYLFDKAAFFFNNSNSNAVINYLNEDFPQLN